jgi:hypothetical protein
LPVEFAPWQSASVGAGGYHWAEHPFEPMMKDLL